MFSSGHFLYLYACYTCMALIVTASSDHNFTAMVELVACSYFPIILLTISPLFSFKAVTKMLLQSKSP